MNSQFWWFVSRASGMVASVLLVLTLIWGLLLTTKVIDRRGLPAWLTDLHRYLGGLTVAFIALHLIGLVGDSYLTFSWADLFVPFASSWKAGPVAWGVGAFWGIVIVEGTSLAQRRMKRSVWRAFHFLSYPVALMAALHSAQAGTDADNPVFRIVSISLIVILTLLTLLRIVYVRPKRAVVPPGTTADPTTADPTEPSDERAQRIAAIKEARSGAVRTAVAYTASASVSPPPAPPPAVEPDHATEPAQAAPTEEMVPAGRPPQDAPPVYAPMPPAPTPKGPPPFRERPPALPDRLTSDPSSRPPDRPRAGPSQR